jgi:hypothetical protein
MRLDTARRPHILQPKQAPGLSLASPQRQLQLIMQHLHIPADAKDRCRIKADKCIKDIMGWDWDRNMVAGM